MCILLVEDEELIRQFLADELVDRGFGVCEAHSGDQAADLMQKPPTPFTFLITDVNMPGQRNGLEVARLMRLHSPSVPIIFITGRPDLSNFPRPLEANEVVLRKPFDMLELLQTMTQMLGQ